MSIHMLVSLLVTSLCASEATRGRSTSTTVRNVPPVPPPPTAGSEARTPQQPSRVATGATAASDDDDLTERLREFKALFVWFQNKFLLLKSGGDELNVYEDGMIPYRTHVQKVFYPPPKGVVTKIHSPVANRVIVLETGDGKKWRYERFKLRRVDDGGGDALSG